MIIEEFLKTNIDGMKLKEGKIEKCEEHMGESEKESQEE